MPSGRKKAPEQAHTCTLHPGTNPTARVEVEWVRGSVASELPQQEVRWGERGGGCKRHNQSNKLNAHHYILQTAFSTVQINGPRLYQVNYLMHN